MNPRIPYDPPTCTVCDRPHYPEDPHAATSMAYQHAFMAKHGRLPTWEDAMAHCDERTKDIQRAGVKAYGFEPGDVAVMIWSKSA